MILLVASQYNLIMIDHFVASYATLVLICACSVSVKLMRVRGLFVK